MTGRLASVSRWALAAIALATGIVAGRQSLAVAIGSGQPQRALHLDGDQPSALAMQAYLTLVSQPKPADIAVAERQALRALAGDPTDVNAVFDMAVVRELQRRPAAELSLMRYADRLSRRNLATQLWWVEYWSGKGDVARTLQHYDNALRTSAAAPTILFPILVDAVADPAVADPTARLLAQHPVWGEQFVQQLAQSGTNMAGIVRVLSDLARLDAPAAPHALATAIDSLLAAQRVNDAWSLYALYRPGLARSPLRDPRFTALAVDPTAFDWQLLQNGVSTNAQQDGVRIDVSPGGGGAALRQVVRLTPGTHRLRFAFTADGDGAGSPGESPVLSVKCLATGALLADTQRLAGALMTLDATVPASCPAQVVEVALQSGDTAGGSSATIHEVALVR